MPYSDFSLDDAINRFSLSLEDQVDLFVATPEVAPSDWLRAILEETLTLALAISTEKARSELIISPLLVELRRVMQRQISIFSGVDFTVDPAQGLNGVCDFLVSLSPEQLRIRAPIIAVVAAKRDNIQSGLGQCIAEMVASRLFNQRHAQGISHIYGTVTTGSLWRFLSLAETTVFIDQREYHIERVSKIMGILVSVVHQATSETVHEPQAHPHET